MKTRIILIASIFGLAGVIIGLILSSNLQTNSQSYAGTEHPKYELQEPSKELLGLENLSKAFVEVSKKITPAVVTINSEQVFQRPVFNSPFEDFFGRDFFDRFFQEPDQQREVRRPVLGSGVIATRNGYIVTNNHVVEKAKKIFVTLPDGRKVKAKVVGTDPMTDVAVIKVKESNLPAAVLGDSDKLEVGEWVLAVGNPFHEVLKHTVTAGIISATGRSNIGLTRYQDFIQTDAAINPGNSGGALVNLRGEVVGINTAIVSGTGGYQGIGFAIPINMVKTVMDSLITKGKVVRGWLGVQIEEMDEKKAKFFGLKEAEGILITRIDEDSPAEKAGLKREDIILRFQGKKPESISDLQMMVASTKPDTKVELLILRNAKKMRIKVKLGELKISQRQEQKEEKMENKLGLQVRTLTPNLARRLGYEGEKGVLIVSVKSGSLAYYEGLRKGDLIKEINRKPIEDEEDYYEIISGVKKGDTILLVIRRGEAIHYITITIPKDEE